MKIEEVFPHEFVKVNRGAAMKTKTLERKLLLKRVAVVLIGAMMCAGCYYYGYETKQSAIKNFEEKLEKLHSTFNEIHRAKRNTEEENSMHHVEKRQSRSEVITRVSSKSSSGAAYIRWGRRDCPVDVTDTVLIYEGVAANTHYTYTGGGSNVLCTDLNVTYSSGHFVEGNQGSSYLFGVEYHDTHSSLTGLFDMSDIESGTFYRYDVPCAVCFATARYTQLMIPGRETCPPGWTKEYSGYILGAAYGNKHTTDYICVDEKPQVVQGSDGDQSGSRLYIAETQCPSLQCGPYVHGRELRCVMCTI